MGNHHSHKSRDVSPNSSHNGSRKSIPRTSSGADIQDKPEKTNEKPFDQMLPIERLAKILSDKAQAEDHINGITYNVFYKYLFPRYPILADKLYRYFYNQSNSKNDFIIPASFKQQCDKYLAILDDGVILDTWVKMWSTFDEVKDSYIITPDAFTSLLMCAYHVSMDHYSGGPQMCLSINKTLKAVVEGCFYQKQSLSSQYVSHWLADNVSRLLLPLHRYAVHAIATAWRHIDQNEPAESTGVGLTMPTTPTGLELTTPVLEQQGPFGQTKNHNPHLLTMSMSWLLAGALPALYSRPQKANSPSSSGTGLASMTFLSKIACSIPSHWTLLYDSDEQGLGANRFLHHVLGYKGPTIVIFRVENNQKFCVCSPCEWKESHHYWGGEGAAVFQLLPKFQLLEKGSKLLYLNTMIRGYPQGLRAGSDPRDPIITVDGGFEKMEWKKIPYYIETIEVWGCGDQVQRERQLEVKKWEVKEAEKQRTLKLSAADWLDHPDRYLLELAGRPQYHQNQT
ncbi:uncharacterized protein LOC126740391 isoform X2 [Anthonomus grandis grandis]|uniref:uncharacterized protein LOC126740391 isoform X2 n=1 Tax=Anthonomus grandis grandis TaxID=2921223 RepID=UPI00216654B1|nr:uncharacterized protein LOC126740391 isoform X2 [Anthonomus grandis grandis]